MRLARQITLTCTMLLFLALGGCSSSLWNRYPPPQPTTKTGLVTGGVAGAVIGGAAAGSVAGVGIGAVAGGLFGATLGHIFEKHMTLVEKLQYNGVQVIRLGDEIEIILPAQRFFKPNSPLMNLQYYRVMDLVGQFIKQFQKVNVKVAGYTDDVGPWQRNLALSKSQAQTIMQYLWNYGIDARLIYAAGYGGKDPIANNRTEKGRALNQRIVITLRRIRDFSYDI